MREKRIPRKSKVSDGRLIRVGLVGPKVRPKGVADGQQVNIPVPPGGRCPSGRAVGERCQSVEAGGEPPVEDWEVRMPA